MAPLAKTLSGIVSTLGNFKDIGWLLDLLGCSLMGIGVVGYMLLLVEGWTLKIEVNEKCQLINFSITSPSSASEI